MGRIALGLAYAGQAFEGWQTQRHGRTVQDVLEQSLSALAGQPIHTVCAGRTDTGVHATAQVVHFDTDIERPLQAWVRGTNAHLPGTVAVQWAVPVSDAFHARFSAQSRSYQYRIYCARQRHPLVRQAAWCMYDLNIPAMQEAARGLVGTHDFSAFRAAQCQAASPVRELMAFEISQSGPYVIFDIRGNAFLHHMVRNLVGSLVEIGLGRKPVDWLVQVLDSKNRSLAARTYPPEGLTLVGVGYDSVFALPKSPALVL